MVKAFLLVGLFSLGLAAGYFLGLHAALPIALKGTLPGLPAQANQWRQEFPPMALTAQGTVMPATGALSIDALVHSIDPTNAMTADIHLGGTLEEPRWEVRSLKKKKVRLRIRL